MQPNIIEGDSIGRVFGQVGSPSPIAGVRGREGAIGFDDPMLGRHVLFLGGIGTGKTVGITHLVDSLRTQATRDDIFVFFDSKGDFIEEFFRPGDVSLSATGDFPGAQIWNVFAELTDGPSLTEQVAEICHSLVGEVDGEGDRNKIWQNMAADLLGALITAYKRSGKPFTNQDIRLMSDSLTVAQMRRIIEPHNDLRGTLQYIAKDDSNTTISVLIFLQQAIRRVFTDSFRQPGDFSVGRFLRAKGGRSLFLEYDLARGASLAPVYRALLDLALRESLGRERAPGRVFVILDEILPASQARPHRRRTQLRTVAGIAIRGGYAERRPGHAGVRRGAGRVDSRRFRHRLFIPPFRCTLP